MPKDYIIKLTRERVPFASAEVFSVEVTAPGERPVNIKYGDLADALHLVASIYQNTFQEQKVTKVTKKVTKNSVTKRPTGFLNERILDALADGRRTLHELIELTGNQVEGRGMSTILRSLEKRGDIVWMAEPETGKKVWFKAKRKGVK